MDVDFQVTLHFVMVWKSIPTTYSTPTNQNYKCWGQNFKCWGQIKWWGQTSKPNPPNPTYLIKKNEYLKKKNENLNKKNECQSSRLQLLLSSSNMLYANMTPKIFVTNICNKDIKKRRI